MFIAAKPSTTYESAKAWQILKTGTQVGISESPSPVGLLEDSPEDMAKISPSVWFSGGPLDTQTPTVGSSCLPS